MHLLKKIFIFLFEMYKCNIFFLFCLIDVFFFFSQTLIQIKLYECMSKWPLILIHVYTISCLSVSCSRCSRLNYQLMVVCKWWSSSILSDHAVIDLIIK